MIVFVSLPRFRHVFVLTSYFPVVMTTVVAALIWLMLFYPRGLLDQLIAPWFPQGVPWLTSPVLLARSEAELLTGVQRSEGFQRAFEAVMFNKAEIKAELDRWNKEVQEALSGL